MASLRTGRMLAELACSPLSGHVCHKPQFRRALERALTGVGRQFPSSLESWSVTPATVGNLARHFSSSATSASLAWLI